MILKIEELTYHTNKKVLIDHLSCDFVPGNLYGILGPNGAGKSTFLKLLARIWEPTSGKMSWNNQNIIDYSRKKMSRTFSLVFQHSSTYFNFTVLDLVQMGGYAFNQSPHALAQAEKALKQVDAWHLRDQSVYCLSGGEKQRVYIARALMTDSPILLLDEPTSYLDLRHQIEIWQLLEMLAKNGKLVIVALHDLIAAQRYCNQVLILYQGRCQTVGHYSTVMTSQRLHDYFGVYLDQSNQLFSSSTLSALNASIKHSLKKEF